MMRGKLIAVLVGLVALTVWAAPAGANPSDLVNQAYAHTEQHHPDSQLGTWALAQVDRHAVTAINTARAFAHDCDGCTSEAVSFQIVLASDTNVFTLTNTATSENLECVSCTAVSVAEQWVVGATSGTVVLSKAGQSALEGVQAQLAVEVALPPAQGLGGILGLADEVSTILAASVTVSPGPSVVSPLAEATPIQEGPTIQYFAQVSN
jgi:hypothetical protein